MINTPNGNRPHIALYGKTNAGKSSVLNGIVGQNMSLVSDIPGTTTDPVTKAMELIPYGPVLFIDTAGIFDDSSLGKLRTDRTYEVLRKTDLALYVVDGTDDEIKAFEEWKINFKKYNIPYILVINKIDIIAENKMEEFKSDYKEACFVSAKNHEGFEILIKNIIEKLETFDDEPSLLGDILQYGDKVIMVVPIDSEAPKGRIILPQVQCIRDSLDNGIKTYIMRDTELESGLRDIENINLVITDSQAFKKVNKIVPKDINLTSFSILFARQKGDLQSFVAGAEAVKNLKPGDRVLISESCSHNVSHEDIGRVKIPKLLNRYVGGELKYDYRVGHDFPEEIEKYSLIIHCGGCMINRKTIINRIEFCKKKQVPITNYGVIIAFLTGILDRAVKIY